MIPKQLHFTYKSDDLPRIYEENLSRWQSLCPGWELHYYSNQKVLKFFRDFMPEYLSDIQKVKQGVVLADLFRYGVLYIHGGMYNDIDTVPLRALPENWLYRDVVIGHEYQPSKFECLSIPSYTKDILCQWSFLAKPGTSLFKEAIDVGIENLRERNFKVANTVDVLKVSGPIHFTNVAKKHIKNSNTLVLDMGVFAPKYLKKTDLSQTVVFHQYHGNSGWKLELSCPHVKLI